MNGRIVIIGVLASLMFFSCDNDRAQGIISRKIEIRIVDGSTQILASDKGGSGKLLGKFPAFPGLDPTAPRFDQNVIKFSNGNAIVLLPDKSVSTPIRAWNDYSHLFDVIFVDVQHGTIGTILAESGTKIRLASVQADDIGFVFQLGKDTCKLLMVNKDGTIAMRMQYSFTVYPDLVSVTKTKRGYLITHDSIDGQQKFLLNKDKKDISPI